MRAKYAKMLENVDQELRDEYNEIIYPRGRFFRESHYRRENANFHPSLPSFRVFVRSTLV